MKSVIDLKTKPCIKSFASVGGKKESEGPLGSLFDSVQKDDGSDSWEKAESLFQHKAFQTAMKKGNLADSDIDIIFGGDLLNQCTGASFGMKDFDIPFAGVYGACSTMALSLCLAALSVDSSCMKTAAAVTSSHFCGAEKQFRKPVEYGGQRPPTAQWTVTGSGCVILTGENIPSMPHIEKIAFGTVCDRGIDDENNMGAAMAPAACDTIARFLECTRTKSEDYDLILTGDLGKVGSLLLYELLEKEHGINIANRHNDCGLMIYDLDLQDVNSGGSGCGCSASVLCAKILPDIISGKLKKVLFTATGALLSQTTCLQGQTIPGIAHTVLITGGENE